MPPGDILMSDDERRWNIEIEAMNIWILTQESTLVIEQLDEMQRVGEEPVIINARGFGNERKIRNEIKNGIYPTTKDKIAESFVHPITRGIVLEIGSENFKNTSPYRTLAVAKYVLEETDRDLYLLFAPLTAGCDSSFSYKQHVLAGLRRLRNGLAPGIWESPRLHVVLAAYSRTCPTMPFLPEFDESGEPAETFMGAVLAVAAINPTNDPSSPSMQSAFST